MNNQEIFSDHGHSIFLIGKNQDLGKSVIISQDKKKKINGYKTEHFQMLKSDAGLKQQIENYKLFRLFINKQLEEHDIQLKKTDEGIENAYLFSYFLFNTTNFDDTQIIIDSLDLEMPAEQFIPSLREYEKELKSQCSKITQLEESVILDQKIFSQDFIEKNFSQILTQQSLIVSEPFDN